VPVTLAQASQNAANAVDRRIIDEFRKSSYLLDRIPIVQAVNPAGGGSTLVYGYRRVITQRAAAFRAINAEYVPSEATTQEYTVGLKPMGGSFQIDRVLARIGPAAANEVTFQLDQLVKATRAHFADQIINGDTAVNANGFDGLSKILTGTSTEFDADAIDWTGVDTQAEALAAARVFNTWLASLDGPPDALLMNKDAIAWLSIFAAFSGQQRSTQDAFGQLLETYRNIPLIDVGTKAGSNDEVIPTVTATGETDIYALRFGEDGFHLVAVTGPLIDTWLPDFTTAGAVKTGEAELGPAAPVLKATRAAGVFRGVQVAAPIP
jgi:hypothetical protein